MGMGARRLLLENKSPRCAVQSRSHNDRFAPGSLWNVNAKVMIDLVIESAPQLGPLWDTLATLAKLDAAQVK